MILNDGRIVRVATATASDAREIVAFVRGLSPTSQYERFFVRRSGDALEAEVVRELACARNLSLVARDASDGRVVGHALGARFGERGAEVAFAVADDVQHLGLGTALARALLDALRAAGVRAFEGFTLPENATMRDVFAAAGFTLHATPHEIRAELGDATA